MDIAEKYNLEVIQDDAQALLSEYEGKKIWNLVHITEFSFNEQL